MPVAIGSRAKIGRFQFRHSLRCNRLQRRPLAGQMLLDGDVAAKDLVRFAGLTPALTHVANLNQPMANDSDEKCGVYEDGVYFRLSKTIQ